MDEDVNNDYLMFTQLNIFLSEKTDNWYSVAQQFKRVNGQNPFEKSSAFNKQP